jgi:hypothetical protein
MRKNLSAIGLELLTCVLFVLFEGVNIEECYKNLFVLEYEPFLQYFFN